LLPLLQRNSGAIGSLNNSSGKEEIAFEEIIRAEPGYSWCVRAEQRR
jgi:hypothetical protein